MRDIQIEVINLRHEFSQQLFFRRAEKQMDHETLAAESGITAEAIAALEAGQKSPGFRTLIRLARALDCTPADLLQPFRLS